MLTGAILNAHKTPEAWVQSPRLVRITDRVLPLAQELLRQQDRSDPYAVSAAYYALTGRRGLWMYSDGTTRLFIARHPNRDGVLLFFPPFGPAPEAIIQKALLFLEIPHHSVVFARVGQQDFALFSALRRMGFGEPQTENVLDWTFPVRIYDTRKVSEHRGRRFRSLRGHINRAERRGIKALSLDPVKDADEMLEVAGYWAKNSPEKECSMIPINVVIDLMRSKLLPIDGLKVVEGGNMRGFVVWEETDRQRGIANSIFSAAISGGSVDEYLVYAMCRELAVKGYKEVCDGGSETAGLDAFKRKMQPVRSIPLMSASYRPDVPAIKPVSCSSVSACAYGA